MISNEAIIKALLTYSTRKEAAKQLNITPQELSRRTKTDAFKNQYSEAKQAILEQTLSSLIALNSRACTALNELLDEESPRVRLDTAKQILNLTKEYDLYNRLEGEVQALRRATEQQHNS